MNNYETDPVNGYQNTANGSTDSLRGDIHGSMDNAKQHARELAHEAKIRAQGVVDTAGHKLSDATDKVAVRVQAKPLQSSLIALGAGFILALLIRR